MSTLSNVTLRRGGKEPPDIGFASDAISEAQEVPKGKSVRYAHKKDDGKEWFVLRATYGRVNKAYDLITKDSTEAYLPMKYRHKIIKGKKKRILEPLIPNIIFVYAERAKIETLVKDTPELYFLNYYYNHFEKGPDGKNIPLTVGYNEMMSFIKATSVDNEHVMLVEPSQCHYKNGDIVRVIEGDFTGVVGRVARVAGQQRVVVELDGLCTIVTAYIPSAFLEIVNKK